MIEHIRVKGYRLFKDFETKLQPGINVLIGANATGKSTLVELLRIVQSCCLGSLRRAIEPRGLPGEVFRPDGPAELVIGLTTSVARGRGGHCGCHYGLRIDGPAASPTIAAEALSRLGPAPKGRGRLYSAELRRAIPTPPRPYRLLFSRLRDRALVYEQPVASSTRPLRLQMGEDKPALSEMTDTRLKDAWGFRADVLSWRFHAELVVHRTAPLREPQPMGRGGEMDERGQNLAPALLSLFTNIEYREQRDDVLRYLRLAFPEFESLTPTTDFSSKYALLQWREGDLGLTLSGADVSDGMLRFLALAVMCCNPHPPSLLCVDEPEVGLHPRVLPIVGAMLRRAARKSQVIVLTHSPELLHGMPLESIGVMRREEGEARIVWPSHHKLLREIVTEEVAGETEVNYERLSQAFISGEMDTLG